MDGVAISGRSGEVGRAHSCILSKKEETLLKEVVKEGIFREIENPKERKRKKYSR